MLTFEWDEAKSVANLVKHGVSFEQAIEVFGDSLSLTITAPIILLTKSVLLR